jgi:long-chain acyl-CoA synthetase
MKFRARLETFPRLLLSTHVCAADRPATREKDLGIWQTWTWSQVAADVRALACGLAAQGFRRGMHWRSSATTGRGSTGRWPRRRPGGIRSRCTRTRRPRIRLVLNDAEIGYALREDQEQVDKVLEAKPQVPHLAARLLRRSAGLAQLRERVEPRSSARNRPRRSTRAHPGFLRRRKWPRVRPDDVSIMLYTSGTTGKPKGVCQTHAAFIVAAQGGCAFDKLGSGDSILAYLPMAWVATTFFSYAQCWSRASRSTARIGRHRDDRPARNRTELLLRAAAHFREPADQVMIRMEDASAAKRWLFRYFTRSRAAAAPRFSTASRSACSIVRSTRSETWWCTGRCAT